MQACTDLHWRISSSRSSMIWSAPEGCSACAMLRAQTPDRQRPGHIPGRTPRAFCVLARHEVALALPLCPHFAALSSAACGVHEGEPGELSAVQLPTLRTAG